MRRAQPDCVVQPAGTVGASLVHVVCMAVKAFVAVHAAGVHVAGFAVHVMSTRWPPHEVKVSKTAYVPACPMVAKSARTASHMSTVKGFSLAMQRGGGHWWGRYWKPLGVLSTTRLDVADNIVASLSPAMRARLPAGRVVAPVGRLDRASSGLLLLTTDEAAHAALLRPGVDGSRHAKTYDVTTDAEVPDAVLDVLRRGGVPLAVRNWGRAKRQVLTLPCQVERLAPKQLRFVLREGKNRQLRKMLGRFHFAAVAIHRVAFGRVTLDGLCQGQVEELDPVALGLLPPPVPSCSVPSCASDETCCDVEELPSRAAVWAQHRPGASVPSPCVKVCKMSADGLCFGCFRTLEEIGRWSSMDDGQRAAVWQLIVQREDPHS